MNRPLRTILFGLCALLLFCRCNDDRLTLVADGQSDYEIVLIKNPTKEHQRAAQELQDYVDAISEVRLPIVEKSSKPHQIMIGTEEMDLRESEVVIVALDGNLILAGGDPKSHLYAVYTFLEEYLGCRFYAPDHEEIPKQSTLSLDSDLSYRYDPEISVRTVHSRLFYEDSVFADKRKLTYEAFPHYVPEARVHTFHRFLPADIHLQPHPEYYALRNGRRIPTQLCLTNESVFEIVRDTVAALIKRHPEAEVVSVSQDDNQQYCQCDQCMAINDREESPAGSVIDFVNRIADEFPDKTISTLAYQYTRKAPKLLQPKDNVLITLCSIECDRSAAISDNCTDFYEDLVAWGRISDNIRIWDYTTQFTNFLAPFPNLLTLQPNVQLFRDNNARWVFEQHSNNPSELFELRSYLTAKLLWNPDLDEEAVIQEFLMGYYAEAAPFVKQYIDRVHNELAADSSFFLFLYGDPSQAFHSFLKPELLRLYNQWFDEAEAAVAARPATLDRVRRARLSIDYASLEASRKNLSDDFRLTVSDEDAGLVVAPSVLERLERFEQTCAKGNITAMNEMRFTVNEYLDGYRASFDRALSQNLAFKKPVKLETRPKKYADEDPQTLTDGSLGGSSFYANWLGFEGNDLMAVIDLEDEQQVSRISTTFLQVINHIVFFPELVTYEYSNDGVNFNLLKTKKSERPLTPDSKINDTQNFEVNFPAVSATHIRVTAKNLSVAPIWHHGAGLPCWIFADEVIIQ